MYVDSGQRGRVPAHRQPHRHRHLGDLPQLIQNPGSTVSLFALADNLYVTAENAGASPLIANRTAIGTWEQFDLITG